MSIAPNVTVHVLPDPIPQCDGDLLTDVRLASGGILERCHIVRWGKSSVNHCHGWCIGYLLGTGWYRKQFDVPAEWKGRQITLQVGRVVMEAWVYVNGREVHHHLGHSTNWEAPLAPHVAFGQSNELVIAVDNTRCMCILAGEDPAWEGSLAQS